MVSGEAHTSMSSYSSEPSSEVKLIATPPPCSRLTGSAGGLSVDCIVNHAVVFSIQHAACSIQHPSTSIQLPSSSIQYSAAAKCGPWTKWLVHGGASVASAYNAHAIHNVCIIHPVRYIAST